MNKNTTKISARLSADDSLKLLEHLDELQDRSGVRINFALDSIEPDDQELIKRLAGNVKRDHQYKRQVRKGVIMASVISLGFIIVGLFTFV